MQQLPPVESFFSADGTAVDVGAMLSDERVARAMRSAGAVAPRGTGRSALLPRDHPAVLEVLDAYAQAARAGPVDARTALRSRIAELRDRRTGGR